MNVFGVFGHLGKMGKEVLIEIERRKEQCRAVFTETPKQGLPKADLWIDFSSPDGLRELLTLSNQLRLPIVSGTTGLSKSDFDLLRKESSSRAILWAPNMSLGIAWLQSVLPALNKLKNFDIQILDFHHSKKVDSPSGTAKALQETLEKNHIDTQGPPLSFRLGGIHGVHQIFAVSESEWITLEHRAMNRSVFAQGAVFAASWLMRQPPGLYSMSDILKE